jgi:triphosphoribosyl-dephospho-CoA synthase
MTGTPAATPTDRGALTASDVAAAAQLACLLEASAPKPGNVSRQHEFRDLGYEDFLASAAAIGIPFAGAGVRPIGETVKLAVEATARWASSNTNLGIILLLAPIARAALIEGSTGPGDRLGGELRGNVGRVLEATTVDDARAVYSAIRLAAPGGLGRVPEQDVAGQPTTTLLDVMRLAADRDAVAHEYATAFQVTFETAVPSLERGRRDGLTWPDAIVETFLTLLAAVPDTHILRRSDAARASAVSRSARVALSAGGVRSAEGRRAIGNIDLALRDPEHLSNPGSTADLVAAATFVVLLRVGRAMKDRGGHAAAR